MNLDTQKLAVALADPAVQALSAADAATLLSTPTGREYPAGKIVFATLASKWGTFAADAFMLAMEGHQGDAGDLGVFARSTLRALNGAGFDSSDPQSLAVAAGLLAQNLCTTAQVDAVFGPLTYRCGGAVLASDVTAARAAIAAHQAAESLRGQWAAVFNNGVAAIDAGQASGTLPTLDVLRQGAAQ